MRLIKMFGLAALAAVAAMAFVGASSASAEPTVLCKVDNGTLKCPEGQEVSSLHGVSVTPPRLLTTSGTVPDVTCETSLSKVSVLPLGDPLIAHFEEVTWVNCRDTTIVKAPCTVENKLLGLAEVLKTGANLASVTLPEAAVFVKCGEAISCTYKLAAGQTLHGTGAGSGSTNGHVTAAGVEVEPADPDHQPLVPVCPDSTWDALYENLTPVYIKS